MRKFFLGVTALLSACAHVQLQNTTPEILIANAANVYPLSMDVLVRSGEIERGSIQARVTVDGTQRRMKKIGQKSYVYDFAMPANRNSATYYFDVDYLQMGEQGRKNLRSPLYTLEISNRYVLGMDSIRGAVGTRVNMIGHGFARGDRVEIGGVGAETTFESPTSMSFKVPTLPAGRRHRVTLNNKDGEIFVGEYFVDTGKLSIQPKVLEVPMGQSLRVTLQLSSPAPKEGLDVSLETTVPTSISVDDVFIEGGKASATFLIEGLQTDSGRLFIAVEGFEDLSVPLFVL